MRPDADIGPLIFVMAGEPSGDALGARLMRALRRQTNGRVRFDGIGGERMAAEGLESLFPMEELSIMGVVEVLPRAPAIYRRIRQTVRRVKDVRPAAVVSIDASGFCFRVERRLKGQGIPLVHYVAPMVWAWRPWKAWEISRFLDHLMALLPFEPPYFEKAGLATSFVGHPVVEEGVETGDGRAFRERYDVPEEARLLCVLPGSRAGEVRRLLPAFGAAVERLAKRYPDLRVVIPAVAARHREIVERVADWPVPTVVLRGPDEKYDALAAADVALAASGSVALELGLAGLPAVIAYRINPVTWAFKDLFLRVPYVNLVNLLLDRPLVPELLQGRCRPDLLAEAVSNLLDDEEARRKQIDGAREAVGLLSPNGVAPSERAAEIVLGIVAKGGRGGGDQ